MKAAETQRIANANAGAGGAPKSIDLAAAPGAAGSGAAAAVTQQQQRSYTDMLEAACMAVIKVGGRQGALACTACTSCSRVEATIQSDIVAAVDVGIYAFPYRP